MNKYGLSETEYKIVLKQIERRAQYRDEFLKLRTDPCQHSKEAGYVFDPSIQRFLSMKTCQYDYFTCNKRTYLSGLLLMSPMFIFGYAAWYQRVKRENEIRCGQLRYRDRDFKMI